MVLSSTQRGYQEENYGSNTNQKNVEERHEATTAIKAWLVQVAIQFAWFREIGIKGTWVTD